ncbi:MAG: MBL fold metallo-hydrolase [Proteobacteria bacterium]|nr:MBL fold metallo-hydrolase [Pseudomonadota bacterium]
MVATSSVEVRPSKPLPTVHTDLTSLDRQNDLIIWLEHSTFYMQLGGRRILVDPVLSDHASPFSFMYRAFNGTIPKRPQDIPDLDAIVISHDHWDHLDYPTMRALRDRVGTASTLNRVRTGLAKLVATASSRARRRRNAETSINSGLASTVRPAGR